MVLICSQNNALTHPFPWWTPRGFTKSKRKARGSVAQIVDYLHASCSDTSESTAIVSPTGDSPNLLKLVKIVLLLSF